MRAPRSGMMLMGRLSLGRKVVTECCSLKHSSSSMSEGHCFLPILGNLAPFSSPMADQELVVANRDNLFECENSVASELKCWRAKWSSAQKAKERKNYST